MVYPLVPWPGVMAAGYVLGPLFKGPSQPRQSFLIWGGAALVAGFIVLRIANLYGDPVGWSPQETWTASLLSFVDCEKYPASLLFLMMTLGPAMILLGLFERTEGFIPRRLTTYGRLPFLFYVVHLPLIHAAAVGLAWLTIGDVGWMFGGFVFAKPAGYGLSLPGVYFIWIVVLLLLYPLCGWFAHLKRRRHDWWLSYL